MEGTSTRSLTGSTSVDACVTNPGYGYYDGQVLQCEFGSYAPGGDQSECADCGEGYNTTRNGQPSLIAVAGATSSSQCAIAAGWAYTDSTDATKGLAPCARGSYKALIGNAQCLQCPAGTTTTLVSGATALTDCNACIPGYGNPSGSIANPSAPSCGACSSGFYSPGGFVGGQSCTACPKPSLFTGKMVSRAVSGRLDGRSGGGWRAAGRSGAWPAPPVALGLAASTYTLLLGPARWPLIDTRPIPPRRPSSRPRTVCPSSTRTATCRAT